MQPEEVKTIPEPKGTCWNFNVSAKKYWFIVIL